MTKKPIYDEYDPVGDLLIRRRSHWYWFAELQSKHATASRTLSRW